MKISIVIPTLNRRELIARTLPTILNQDLAPDDYEVIVVSDGSTDGTVDFLRGIKTPVQLRVIQRPHSGLAATRNAGIEAARGEIVLLIDDDMVGEPALAARHVAAHIDDPQCVVIGSLSTSPESRNGLATRLVSDSHQAYREQLLALGPARSEYRLWLAANFSAPRKLLLAHGGYDERFLYSEDHELAIRLYNAGVRFKFVPDARVCEIYSKTSDQVVASDARRIGAADIRLSRKHHGYRPASILSSLFGQTRSKLMAWWMCCAPPLSPDLALRIPCSIAEALRANAGMESLGLRVLQYRKAIAVMRSALREAGSWRALRREFGMRLPVLRYGQITAADRFEAQVRWLARRGFVGIAPSQWIAWVKTGQTLPEHPVLFSFDGGYAQSAQCAMPILLRYGFGAVVHVSTGAIAGKSVSNTPPSMTPDQIRYWAGKGIEFGSHGRGYCRLTELTSDRLDEEVEGSAAQLAQLLERRPVSFSYPYGLVNNQVIERVRGSFEMALGDAPGFNALCTDLHIMHSSAIGPSCGILNIASALLFGRASLSARNSLAGSGDPARICGSPFRAAGV